MKIIVVTPTYNEKVNIKTFLEEVLAQHPDIHVVIVDDHSPDGTAQLVTQMSQKNARIHLIERAGPRGRGYADRLGMKYAIDQGFDYILQMDADCSHAPVYIPDFLKAIPTCDVVLGSRLIAGGGIKDRSWLRNVITHLANTYIRLVLRLPVKDCTSGYRCYRREVLSSLHLDKFISPGPSLLEEILYACHRKGYVIREIPIIFYDRKKGGSKLNTKELLRIFIYILQFRLNRT